MAAFTTSRGAAQPSAARHGAALGGDAPNAIEVSVPRAPAPARVDGGRRLVYEVHVTNLGRVAVALDSVAVGDADRGTTLATYAGASLAAALGRPGLGPADQHQPMIEAGMRAVLYLDVAHSGSLMPRRLTHRLGLTPRAGDAGAAASAVGVVDAAPVAVRRDQLRVLGPPLRGGPWVAAYAPEMDRGHRRVFYALGGRARIPGRFAIDWFRVDARGRTRPDTAAGADRVDAFYGYGADVLAVADAVVAATRDGVGEPARAADAPRVRPADAAGNYVTLDLGGGRYAYYEHLRPGLRVRPGDRVLRGQVIGAVGFTGSTRVPHLHFHVADAPSVLGAEGEPYTLTGFRWLGGYASIEQFDRGGPWTPAPTGTTPVTERLPSPNAVVQFTQARRAAGPSSASR